METLTQRRAEVRKVSNELKDLRRRFAPRGGKARGFNAAINIEIGDKLNVLEHEKCAECAALHIDSQGGIARVSLRCRVGHSPTGMWHNHDILSGNDPDCPDFKRLT